MHYVGNNHVAADAAALGFPSIKACQAIVYQTNAAIYGFHDMKGDVSAAAIQAKCNAFAAFVQNQEIAHATNARQLYGVINRDEQYAMTAAGNTEWAAMLAEVATALNFAGHIFGVRITTHVSKGDSIYVRFDVAGTDCTIRWKRWSKMDLDKSTAEAVGAEQQELGKTSAYGMAPVYGSKAPFAAIYRVGRKGKNGAILSSEGNLNTVSARSLITIR